MFLDHVFWLTVERTNTHGDSTSRSLRNLQISMVLNPIHTLSLRRSETFSAWWTHKELWQHIWRNDDPHKVDVRKVNRQGQGIMCFKDSPRKFHDDSWWMALNWNFDNDMSLNWLDMNQSNSVTWKFGQRSSHLSWAKKMGGWDSNKVHLGIPLIQTTVETSWDQVAAPKDRAQAGLRRENGPQPGHIHIGIIGITKYNN